MSKDLPQPQQSEEVDLGQLFKLIGNAFDRLFRFIGHIFNKLFLAFVWLIFFIKKHFIKFVIAGVVGIALGILLEKTSEPVYKSYITVKQNYKTGENLYNSIAYYNDLVMQEDVNALEKILSVEPGVASSILDFEIKSIITENQKIKEFDSYLKTLDTTLAKTIEYKTYLQNSEDYNHRYQQITIKSKERHNFNNIFDKVVHNANTSDYFLREQEKDLNDLNNRELALKVALAKSDSLQTTYKRVLEKVLDGKSSTATSITIEGANEKDKTKEYDLYLNDIQLRRELVEIEREKEDKKEIVEIVSSTQDSGTVDDKKEIFGFAVSPKIFYATILMFLTFIVLLGLQAIKFLERYKSKI